MKIQDYGQATVSSQGGVDGCPPIADRFSHHFAWRDYPEKRANGEICDNPEGPLPKDGSYTWEEDKTKPKKNGCNWYWPRYNGGPGDRAWMEQRDRNYIARLEQEGGLKTAEPDVWCCGGYDEWVKRGRKIYTPQERESIVKERAESLLVSTPANIALQMHISTVQTSSSKIPAGVAGGIGTGLFVGPNKPSLPNINNIPSQESCTK